MLIITLLYWTHGVRAQNVDFYHVPSLEEIQPLTHLPSSSLFGFSTTYDKINSRMIISAPRENNIGEVYECNMLKDHKCSKLHKDVRRLVSVKNYSHNYWFGATVKAASTFVVTCAPGYTDKPSNTVNMYGDCYKLNSATNSKKFGKKLLTSYHTAKKDAVGTEMETLGWSLAVGSDDSVIVGGPAMYSNFTGTAAVLRPKISKDMQVQRIEEMDGVETNFGYSVAVGNFLGEDKLYYAVGSTYGHKGYGQVNFYSLITDTKLDRPIKLSKEIDIDLVGTMFGAVLCAVKLNKVGDDLLVGAPGFAFEAGYNEGAVYVYIYSKKNSSPKFKRRITNRKVGSFFGSAIVSVGDLNNDGRDEVAIAAPHEDDLGAVYLYCGATLLGGTSEKTLKWMQRLEPTYNSFGLSLTALPDYDDNGCNELAVSSPYANKVLVYKCWASVTVTNLYTRFPNLQNRSLSEQTDFAFDVCMDIKYPAKPINVVATISTTVEMTHLYAKLLEPNDGSRFNFKTSLSKDKPSPYCQPVKFTLPKEKDYGNKINYEISLKLLDNPLQSTLFSKDRVILSDLSKLSYSGSVLAVECNKEKCEPKLDLSISTNLTDPFTTGSKERHKINIAVKNTGEVAYDPCVQFHISGVPLYQAPMGCSKVASLDDTWECTVRKPVWTKETWNIKNIIVDLNSLTNADKTIKLNATVFNQCSEQASEGATAKYEIHLKTEEKFNVTGKTNIGEIVSLTSKHALHEGKKLEHLYTIVNKGMTNFVNIKAKVTLWKNDFIKYLKVPVSYFKYSKGLEDHKDCKDTSEVGTEMKIECVIDSLARDDYAKIVIPMEILPSDDLANALKKENMTLNSDIILEAMDLLKTKRISTLIQLKEALVPVWIFILAGLLGLVITLCLVYGLSRCGFLRRENKQKLEDLKEKVRRQSTRRSQMRKSEDRKEILEEMNELEDVSEPSAPCMYSQSSSVAE